MDQVLRTIHEALQIKMVAGTHHLRLLYIFFAHFDPEDLVLNFVPAFRRAQLFSRFMQKNELTNYKFVKFFK